MDELYKAFNINSLILYNLKKTVKLTFKILKDDTIKNVLQVIYTFSISVNLISTKQLRKDGIEYNRYKDCFVIKIG